ncbi:uroporphyrinogen-III C-methyltransferase [Haloactinopolyspora alba]|uniref:uroporphyrinogen-III C-methyltransferase n=1 Tax=Haloactinopolyspora alba TaxID=648780 RepID=A0A2P8EFR8_9ACTN|nr:uroporphyrinogen-III C-methyltransferase [Haloactinopolyspora alba]PSL08311.1 uroporphyrinogen-III C-methyltransferase [Haloactinopolyspora alba]
MSGVIGHVAIVGGGPGDPGLLTLRGFDLLKQADVVLVDRLAPHELLEGLRPDVEIVDVGKAPHKQRRSQEEIEELMLERARAGKRVVRLKGGDPYVFGRGSEEAAACARAGVAYELVPGVTSATAVPGLAGIPVTQRGVTQEVTLVSGHAHPDDPGSTVDWERLGAGGGTVVVLMGVTHLPVIAERLVRGGRPEQTPVAVVRDVAGASAQLVTATLATVAEAAREVRPPAIIVVGDVVAEARSL